jgi:carboxylate-amine ligase
MTSGLTLGVEEELHVVDAATGRLASRGPDIQRSSLIPVADGAVVLELTLSQVETVTAVSEDVTSVAARSGRLRSAVATAANGHGLALLASGTPVLGDASEQLIADDERYTSLRTRAAGLVTQQLIAGMHVHVGVGGSGLGVGDVDDDARVAVANAVRPWLGALLALTANSPYWLGVDTGFASYRQVHWQRWPVVGPPPACRDGAEWHRSVAELVATGVVDDASYVYWDVRLATRFPTVEVRVADVQVSLDEARRTRAWCVALPPRPCWHTRGRCCRGRRWRCRSMLCAQRCGAPPATGWTASWSTPRRRRSGPHHRCSGRWWTPPGRVWS